MIDWLSSKFALFVASLLILASAFSIIGIQRRSIGDFELERIADDIASRVNSVALTNGQSSQIVEFDNGSEDDAFPTDVGGSAYTVNLTPTAVLVLQDEKRFMAKFVKSVHLWYPDMNFTYSFTIMEGLDKTHRYLQLKSGTDFVVEQKLVRLEERNEYHTFIYER
jgi:hypothetical protein